MLLASDRLSSTAKQAACHGGSAQRGWLWLKATGIHGEPCDPNYQLLVEVRRIVVACMCGLPVAIGSLSSQRKERGTKEGSRGAATVVSAWKLYAPWQTQINRAVDS